MVFLHDYLEHEWYTMGMWKLQRMCKLSVCDTYERVCMPIYEIITCIWLQSSLFDFYVMYQWHLENPASLLKQKKRICMAFLPLLGAKTISITLLSPVGMMLTFQLSSPNTHPHAYWVVCIVTVFRVILK